MQSNSVLSKNKQDYCDLEMLINLLKYVVIRTNILNEPAHLMGHNRRYKACHIRFKIKLYEVILLADLILLGES